MATEAAAPSGTSKTDDGILRMPPSDIASRPSCSLASFKVRMPPAKRPVTLEVMASRSSRPDRISAQSTVNDSLPLYSASIFRLKCRRILLTIGSKVSEWKAIRASR